MSISNFGLVLLAQAASPSPTPSPFDKLVADHPAVALSATIIVASVGLGLFLKYSKSDTAATDEQFRHLVAKSVLYSAIWGLVLLAILAAILGSEQAKNILNLLLPVFGTWVGTLLAYYFGKDNYESGARNSANLAKALTGIEKLKSIPVTQPGIMIRVADIKLPTLVQNKSPSDFGQIVLKDLVGQMKEQRLPLIDPASGAAIAIVHKSLLNDFLVKMQLATKFDTATLKDLLDDPGVGNVAKSSFALVPDTATLADVKVAMTQRNSANGGVCCEDAFVTGPGSFKVEGWITSDIIDQNSQV